MGLHLAGPRLTPAPLSPADWHQRFRQQAGWTQPTRDYLLKRLGLHSGSRILEVGCGTGAVTSALADSSPARVFGLDFDFPLLTYAHSNDSRSLLSAANAYALPFPAGVFDAVVCHFLLLWIRDIPAVLAEMRRVTRPGGWILALAEPDYGGRIDYPAALTELGQWQTFSLENQGAQTQVGRRLMAEFLSAGLRQVESGLMGGQWNSSPDTAAFAAEWKIVESDLSAIVSPARLAALRGVAETALRKGDRILFVPTFYAIGCANPPDESKGGAPGSPSL